MLLNISKQIIFMITKDELFRILTDWNMWERDQETGFPRDTYNLKIKNLLKTGQIVTLTGVRRAGKSTLMKQQMRLLIQSGVPRNEILYVNLEDPRFEGELSLPLLTRVYEVYMENMKPVNKPYIFLDEIQEIAGWEKFVVSLQERNAAHVVVSGSSSRLLSSEFSTLLTGRHLDVEVFPLDFPEYLYFSGMEPSNRLNIVANRIKVEGLLKEYIESGGFPLAVLTHNKQILSDYFRDIIFKDVVYRHRIREVDKVNALAKFYLTNISSQITFNKIKNFLNTSIETIERFSHYLASSYLIFFLKRFSYSVKDQEKSPRKVYAIDTGLRNVVAHRFLGDYGRLAENIVFLHLLKLGKELYYWKDKEQREVDFIIKEGMRVEGAVQVCWALEDEKTKKREVGGLVKAAKELKLRKGMVITSEYKGEEKVDDITIKYVPLSSFLLNFY
jgi:predicted AAA+ superfamily ATPase